MQSKICQIFSPHSASQISSNENQKRVKNTSAMCPFDFSASSPSAAGLSTLLATWEQKSLRKKNRSSDKQTNTTGNLGREIQENQRIHWAKKRSLGTHLISNLPYWTEIYLQNSMQKNDTCTDKKKDCTCSDSLSFSSVSFTFSASTCEIHLSDNKETTATTKTTTTTATKKQQQQGQNNINSNNNIQPTWANFFWTSTRSAAAALGALCESPSCTLSLGRKSFQ